MWDDQLDVQLRNVVFQLAFDWDKVAATLRKSFRTVTAEACRARFAELQARDAGQSSSTVGDDAELDLDALLIAEDMAEADAASEDVVRASRLPLGARILETSRVTSTTRSISSTGGIRQELLTDASAFDFDAEAALTEADAHIAAAIDAAMLQKLRGGVTTQNNRPTTDALKTVGSGEVAREELTGEAELIRIEALSASKGAARQAAQTAMFERVLGALGGPLDESASQRVLVPAAKTHADPSQAVARQDSTQREEAEPEQEEAASDTTGMQSVTDAFFASLYNGSQRGHGDTDGRTGPQLHSNEKGTQASAFRGTDDDATLAAWDVLLSDVQLPEERTDVAARGGGAGAPGTAVHPAATTAPQASEWSMGQVLDFLADESARSKQEQAARAAMRTMEASMAGAGQHAGAADNYGMRTVDSQQDKRRRREAETADMRAPIAAAAPPVPRGVQYYPVEIAGSGNGVSSRSGSQGARGAVGAPVDARRKMQGRYGRAASAEAHVEHDEDEVVVLRAQRAALKLKASDVHVASAKPSTDFDEQETQLMQMLRAGRAAAGIVPASAPGGIVQEAALAEPDAAVDVQGEGTAVVVQDDNGAYTPMYSASNGSSVGEQAVSAVAGLLATVGAMGEVLVHAGAIREDEACVDITGGALVDYEAAGINGATARKTWVHSTAKNSGASSGPASSVILGARLPVSEPSSSGGAEADTNAQMAVDDEEDAISGGFSTRVMRKVASDTSSGAHLRESSTHVPAGASTLSPGKGAGPPTASPTMTAVEATATAARAQTESAMPSDLPWKLAVDAPGPFSASKAKRKGTSTGPVVAAPAVPLTVNYAAPPGAEAQGPADQGLLRAVLGGGTAQPTITELQRNFMQRHWAVGSAAGGGPAAGHGQGGDGGPLPRFTA